MEADTFTQGSSAESREMVSGVFTKGLLLLGLLSGLALGQDEKPRYKDPSVPVEERVTDLLGRMTLEEKMSQLIQGAIGIVSFLPTGGTDSSQATSPIG